MEKRRVYVDEALFQEVRQFAKDRYILFKERSPEGVRIDCSFPFALNRYIELKIRGGI
jgi:hypothetical protein